MLLFDTLPEPPSKLCCTLQRNRNLKHVALASLWQHNFADRHVVSAVQSGAPKTWHSRQHSWKPIDLFRRLKTATHTALWLQNLSFVLAVGKCAKKQAWLVVHQNMLTQFAIISATCSFTRAYADRYRGVGSGYEGSDTESQQPSRSKYEAWQHYIETFGTTVHPNNRFFQALDIRVRVGKGSLPTVASSNRFQRTRSWNYSWRMAGIT